MDKEEIDRRISLLEDKISSKRKRAAVTMTILVIMMVRLVINYHVTILSYIFMFLCLVVVMVKDNVIIDEDIDELEKLRWIRRWICNDNDK